MAYLGNKGVEALGDSKDLPLLLICAAAIFKDWLIKISSRTRLICPHYKQGDELPHLFVNHSFDSYFLRLMTCRGLC